MAAGDRKESGIELPALEQAIEVAAGDTERMGDPPEVSVMGAERSLDIGAQIARGGTRGRRPWCPRPRKENTLDHGWQRLQIEDVRIDQCRGPQCVIELANIVRPRVQRHRLERIRRDRDRAPVGARSQR